MKLVKHLSPIPPPYGGVTIHIKRLIEKLQNDGYSAGAYFNTGNKVFLENLTTYKGFSKKLFFRSLYYIVKDTKDYKIVHTHNFFDDAMLLYFSLFFGSKKIVVSIHNDRSKSIYYSQNIIFRYFIRKLSQKKINWITVSEIAKKELLKLPLHINEIEVIPAYIPKIENSKKTSLSKSILEFTKKYDKIIVFYAYSSIVDNIDLYGTKEALMMFNELVKKSNKYGLVFCVSDIDSDLSILKQFAKKNDIYDYIFWQVGPINDMYELWSISHLYIRPNVYDGDSISIREALEMNLKVVASDVAKRPNGVVTYKYGNISDFFNKVLKELQKKKKLNSKFKNFENYNKILKIYLKLFNEKK